VCDGQNTNGVPLRKSDDYEYPTNMRPGTGYCFRAKTGARYRRSESKLRDLQKTEDVPPEKSDFIQESEVNVNNVQRGDFKVCRKVPLTKVFTKDSRLT
jgi:hypothetical protein